jgi:hypothetical protein
MSNDQLDQRLGAASNRLAGLSPSLQAGEPWALATRFDHAPEAAWGPREILAHVGEMLSFWLAEAERVLGASDGPPQFGRTATDEARLASIEHDRRLALGELEARVQLGIDRWRRRLAELDPARRARTGIHVTRGEMTVADIATRLVVGHLEEHVDQLAGAVGGEPAAR